ncbi:hypothetical protein EDB85DRAFT_2141421 [Lactarius pseudohatsudake]|nr:hypothetical protein EDB85DRAFT_2141421 [Lactarius pseudohatsudake]
MARSRATPTPIPPLRGSQLSMPPVHPPMHAASDLNHDDDNDATYHSDLDYHHYATTTGVPRNLYPGETPAIVDRETASPCGPNHANVPPRPAPSNATASDDDEAMMVRRRRQRQSNRDNATTAKWHRDTDDDSHSDNGDDDSKIVLRRRHRRRCSDSDNDDDTDHRAAATTTTVMTVRRQ